MKDKEADLSKGDMAVLNSYKRSLDNATKFIPFWVKIAVEIALGRFERRAVADRDEGRARQPLCQRVIEPSFGRLVQR